MRFQGPHDECNIEGVHDHAGNRSMVLASSIPERGISTEEIDRVLTDIEKDFRVGVQHSFLRDTWIALAESMTSEIRSRLGVPRA